MTRTAMPDWHSEPLNLAETNILDTALRHAG
jgi:hypothetical protein